ncbi:MAG TPA: hypothetical protein PKA93_13660, partial [Arachnia sp.]|nr:hypothetical protein [Arachnia sp.]
AIPAAAVVGRVAAAGALIVAAPRAAAVVSRTVVACGLGRPVAELERTALSTVQRTALVGVVAMAASGGVGAFRLPLFSGPARLLAWFHHEESSR